jgi:hypothetical protein
MANASRQQGRDDAMPGNASPDKVSRNKVLGSRQRGAWGSSGLRCGAKANAVNSSANTLVSTRHRRRSAAELRFAYPAIRLSAKSE